MFSMVVHTFNEVFVVICRRERKKYHSHREKSRTSPDKYMTIIVDGTDQSKTNLPYTKVIAKSTSGLWKLRMHVTAY